MPVDDVERATQPGSAGRTTSGVRFGHLAAAWALLFALLHVFWALGGSWLLATSAGSTLAGDRPAWFVVLGLWGVAVVLLAGSALGLALARPRTSGRATRLGAVLGCLAGALLLLRGVAVEVVLLTDAGDVAGDVGEAQTRMSLLLWNPWFVLGGLLFIAAGVQSRRAGP